MVILRKIRLYLDSSVVCDIESETERGNMTREFFRYIAENPDEYELTVSPVLKRELNDANENQRKITFDFIDRTPHTELAESTEADDLTKLYVQEGVLSDKHTDDLAHVAYAVIFRCDYVVSWNMKHLVKDRTMRRVNDVNTAYRYPAIVIVTPLFITGEKTDASN
ncbi:hypothetical protein FACS189443_4230 [Planctomycetales bacterium]|nr:hypothetical protein FACS189443_4230 [Planctomycetales bacterium]